MSNILSSSSTENFSRSWSMYSLALASIDKIPSMVLLQSSSSAMIPTLSSVSLISQCSSSLVTLDLPRPVPPVRVTSSPCLSPYSFLFNPL